MTKMIPILFFLLFSGCHYNRQKESRETEKAFPVEGEAVIEFSEQIHNFGTRESGEILSCSFLFQNRSSGDFVLGKTESGCDCLEINTVTKTVRPGEEGRIDVVFRTSGLYGRQIQAFRVSNDSGTIRKDLAVTAEIINNDIHFQ